MERKRYEVTLAPHEMTDAVLSHEDALKRCTAAARLALRGDRWGYSMVIDCAADIMADVMCETIKKPRHGRPADVSRWIEFCWKFPTAAQRYSDGVSRDALSMSRLVGMASNWRRAYLTAQERTMKVGAENTRLSDGATGMMPDAPVSDPTVARERAVEMLDLIGMPRLGKLYPVAYAAARETAGLTGDEIAAELGMAPATLRKQLGRAAGKVPSAAQDADGVSAYTPREHAEAMRVDEYRPAGKRGDVKPMSGADHNEWRGNGATVPVYPVSVTMVEPTATPWNGEDSADWTHDIAPQTAARLAQAAKISRDRAERRDPLTRDAQRAAAGLPAAS